MPDDLQYLPPEKRRDPSRAVRLLALEALVQVRDTHALSSPYTHVHAHFV